MDITIRRAVPGDVDGIIRILWQIAEVHRAGRPDICRAGVRKYSAVELEALVRGEDPPAFVAADDTGNPVGCCLCTVRRYAGDKFLVDHTSLFIDDFGVDETCRGQGVGTKLFAAAKEHAKHVGAYDIGLNVWEFNERAVRFYERCGFSPRNRHMEMIL